MRFHAEREFRTNKIAVYLVDESGAVPKLAQPVVMATADDTVAADPFMRLKLDEAQRLMDELWDAGLRPSQGAGSAGAMSATERHLEDMRRLVFKGE